MSAYGHIKRCLELSDRDIASALAERHLVRALLEQLAKISRPGDGAAKVLIVFARMATGSTDWMDGALRVEMASDGEATTVEVLSELGLGMRERVFPSFKLGVPLEELVRAVERVPHMIAPLTLSTVSEKRLVLTAAADGDDEAEDVAAEGARVSIADDSLYGAERRATSKPPAKLAEEVDPSSEATKPARRNARPKSDSARPKAAPPASGKTLRPAPPPPATRGTGEHAALRIAPPPAVPRAPLVPRTDDRGSEPKRAIVARVPLTKVQVVKGAQTSRASRPPKRPSVKPEAVKPPSKAPPPRNTKAPPPPRNTKAPSARNTKVPPPRNSKPPPPRNSKPPPRPRVSEPPDEDGIDGGWD